MIFLYFFIVLLNSYRSFLLLYNNWIRPLRNESARFWGHIVVQKTVTVTTNNDIDMGSTIKCDLSEKVKDEYSKLTKKYQIKSVLGVKFIQLNFR